MGRKLTALLAALSGVMGCGPGVGGDGSGPARSPAISVRPAGPSTPSAAAADVIYTSDWTVTPVGSEPAAFRDPTASMASVPYWLAPGRWQVARVETPAYTGLVYRASDEAPQPWLSFRVLQTAAIPGRFRIDATVQAVSSPHFKAPVGEISLIPYYLDPSHYMEVLLTGDNLAIWLADGAEPDTDAGWTGLRFLPVKTAIGALQTLAIDVDLPAHSLTVTAGDQTASVTHSFLDAARPHQVAVRSAGNTFNLTHLQIRE